MKKNNYPFFLIFKLAVVLIILPFSPLLLTFQWNWWEAWLYGTLTILGFLLSRILAAKKHPDIIKERITSYSNKGVKAWDKFLSPAMAFGGLFIPLVAGLDVNFNWSDKFSLVFKFFSLVIFISGYILGTYALVTNKFFSATVRIQTDRGHTVCNTGPYSWIRHPGYTGALLTYLGTPIILDSVFAFIPVGLLFVITFIRTYLEDKTLKIELDGYKEYTKKTRFRLLPFIW